jgi:hypothetical protein
MKNEQLISELNSILDQLDKQIIDIQASCKKLQVALVGVLRITNDDGLMLSNLQGNPEHLKSYLIRLCSDLSTSATQSYERLHERVVGLIDSISCNRKS